MYFIPREECYIEDNNLIYRRIFLFRFIFKELKIPLLDIKNIKIINTKKLFIYFSPPITEPIKFVFFNSNIRTILSNY